jgi:hypothetical protein
MTTAAEKSVTNPFTAIPPWMVAILMFSGGGASGTILPRLLGSDGITKAEVQEVVDAAIQKNNEYFLQRIELMIAKDKLAERSDRTSATAPRPEP